MSASSSPKQPSQPTVKRLFAVSGNICAFPRCATPLIESRSGSVIGEICHINGSKPGAARYDPSQTDEQRHGYDNLILLCNVHHKIIDDDDVAYTSERLRLMKQEHEARHISPLPVDEATAERFAAVAINNSTIHGGIVSSYGQIGGQTAYSITNHNYTVPPGEEPIRLEGKLDMAADLGLLRAIGCPGMRLTVICRGSRPVKIKSAHLLVDDVNVMDGLQQGFAADFGYTPLEGSTQTLAVELIPLSRPNSQEGYVLSRDDVARFFYPLPIPATTLALKAKPDNLSMVVEFFDDSEQTVITGAEIKNVLECVYKTYHKRPGRLNVPIEMAVKVCSTSEPGPEMADLIGKVNPNYVPFVDPEGSPAKGHTSEEPS